VVQLRHMLHSRDTVNVRGTVHVCGPVNVRVTECRIQPEEHDTASLADSVCGQLILVHRSFGRGGRPHLFPVKHVGLVKNQKRLIGTSLKSSGVRQQSLDSSAAGKARRSVSHLQVGMQLPWQLRRLSRD